MPEDSPMGETTLEIMRLDAVGRFLVATGLMHLSVKLTLPAQEQREP